MSTIGAVTAADDKRNRGGYMVYNREGTTRSQLDNYCNPSERPHSKERSTRRIVGFGLEEDESAIPTAEPTAPVSPPSDPGIALLTNLVGTA